MDKLSRLTSDETAQQEQSMVVQDTVEDEASYKGVKKMRLLDY